MSTRGRLFKGVGATGAALLGLGYMQRLPKEEDHQLAWSRSITTRLYSSFVLPLILRTDPETAHNLTLQCGQAFQALRGWCPSWPLRWLLEPSVTLAGPCLAQTLLGLRFDGPVGLAAGFDKNGLLLNLYKEGLGGLGFAEVGSVSAQRALGNVRPRCWRIPCDEVVVNAMGLNNDGCEEVAQRLKEVQEVAGAPIGVNIAKTHDPSILGPKALEDFERSFQTLAPLADFVVLNVSCPNTTEGKTFEEPEALAELLKAVKRQRKEQKPILVKLMATPDTEEGRRSQRELLEVIERSGTVDGLVISNTIKLPEAPLSKRGRQEASEIPRGGVSGRVIHQRSVAAIRSAYEATGGRLLIIGVGGTDSAEAAYEKIRAGASLLEVYTGLVYKGPGLLQDLQTGLRRLLEKDGFKNISEAVGIDARNA